jgi:hypothetical protein
MSDITKLISLGVITKEINVADMHFKLETPSAEGIKGSEIGDIISQFVVEIDGKDYRGEAEKKGLSMVVSKMQSGLVGKLIETCNEMLEEQSKMIEGFFSKK